MQRRMWKEEKEWKKDSGIEKRRGERIWNTEEGNEEL